MKAIVVDQFGGPEVMKLKDVADPRPGPGQVLVRVRAVGVNPVETYIRSGIYGDRPMPYTPGSDAGGVVEAIGDGVGHLSVGDRVYTSGSVTGTYAELALCQAGQVHGLPSSATFEQGAALGIPYATAHRALFGRGHARAGETVLVHGASGGVGLACVQFGRACGATIIGSAGTDQGLQLVRDNGAHHVVNHKSDDHFRQITDITSGRGVDLILEMAAHVNLGKDLTILAPRGRVVVIGSRKPVEINARDAMRRDADIRGMLLANTPPDELIGIHSAIIAGLENGTLRPVIARTMPLTDAPRAHIVVMESSAQGKIVLVP